MNDNNELNVLQNIEKALAAHQGLKDVLPKDQWEATLEVLQSVRNARLAVLADNGVIAQDHSIAVGERGILARDVGGHIIVGDNVTINEISRELLDFFARQFGFDPSATDGEALRSYFNKVIFERHSKVSFLFIRPETGQVFTEADIETIFVPLRIIDPERVKPERKKTRRLEKFGELPNEMASEARTVALPELLEKYPCFILRGKPGCGKTTLLRHIALAFARGEQEKKLGWKGATPLPLLVPLRNFGTFLRGRAGRYFEPQPRALLEYLKEHLLGAGVRFSEGFLERLLEEGKCLLLLDALDEVSGELAGGGDLRSATASQAAAFIRRYLPRGNRFVLSTRPRAYSDEGSLRRTLPQLVICDVLDLDREGYSHLVANLLAVLNLTPETGLLEAQDLELNIERNQQLRELAGNPLMCTTLVLVYKYRGRKLPERRVDVLHEITMLLLGRWEEEKQDLAAPDGLARWGAETCTSEQAIQFQRRALTAVAWEMQQSAMPEIPAAQAIETLRRFYYDERRAGEAAAQRWAEQFLEITHERSGLLIAVDEGIYAFSHQAFREYLAATHLVNRGEEELLKTILAHAPEPDEWWEQVLLLAGAHPRSESGPAGRIVDALLGEDDLEHAYLAARFAQDMTGNLPGAQRIRLQNRLLENMRSVNRPAKERVLAGRGLALAGDPRFRADAWYLPDDPLLGFVEVPAGQFIMGSDPDIDIASDFDECPQHIIKLPRFLIGRYPVTVAQFNAFIQAGGYKNGRYWIEARNAFLWSNGNIIDSMDGRPRDKPDDYGEPFNLTNHPVVGITWYEMMAYTRWLTEQLRKWDSIPDMLHVLLVECSWEIILPSEAEWEKAARGIDGRRYSWGEHFDEEKANVEKTGILKSNAVGCFHTGVSPFGVEEIAGNVWEWTRSIYKNYPYDRTDGRESLILKENPMRVLRGGSFFSDEWGARCGYRSRNFPSFRLNRYGFRIALVSPSILGSVNSSL